MNDSTCPAYLSAFREVYAQNPRSASRQWFREARFGLFVHYALPSLFDEGSRPFQDLLQGRDDLGKICLGTPEEIQALDISEADKALCLNVKQNLKGRFKAERFDAEAICDLALAAEMKYITFITRHAGGLFFNETGLTEFTSTHAPAGRDLLAEVSAACHARGLGCFHYVPPDTARTDGLFRERNARLLRELLRGYGPVAGIWFDGISLFNRNPQNYEHLAEHYRLVRDSQPQTLVSFKEGAIGEEDFISPEHFLLPDPVDWTDPGHRKCWDARLRLWKETYEHKQHLFKDALREICTTMQESLGRDGRGKDCGWINNEKARHLTGDEVWFHLSVARALNANLLMNIGLRADGSIHPDDDGALREVGGRIRKEGFPEGVLPGVLAGEGR